MQLDRCTYDVHTSRVDIPMIMHKSTIDSTRFDSCMELQSVWTGYLPFDLRWLVG